MENVTEKEKPWKTGGRTHVEKSLREGKPWPASHGVQEVKTHAERAIDYCRIAIVA